MCSCKNKTLNQTPIVTPAAMPVTEDSAKILNITTRLREMINSTNAEKIKN
jgi:hypothetical protein